MADAPTVRQVQFLRTIEDYWAVLGFAPTVRDLARLLAVSRRGKPLSTNAVEGVLQSLESKGLVKRTERAARTLRVTPKGAAYLRSPEQRGGAR